MFARSVTWLLRIELLILSVLLTLMIGLAGTQILLRNLFDSGIAWGDPLLRILVLWTGLLGAMLATRDNKHIRIDILSRYLPHKGKKISGMVTGLFSSGVCALLAWHSGRFVYYEMQDGMEVFDGMPAWIAESILPFGFGVISLRFLIYSWQSFKGDTE